jgi:hypothetical protein
MRLGNIIWNWGEGNIIATTGSGTTFTFAQAYTDNPPAVTLGNTGGPGASTIDMFPVISSVSKTGFQMGNVRSGAATASGATFWQAIGT